MDESLSLRSNPGHFIELRAANASAVRAVKPDACAGAAFGATGCANCKTAYICFGEDDDPYEIQCDEGQVCQPAGCVVTPAPGTPDGCVCDTGNEPSIKDPFDETAFIVCPSGDLSFCAEGQKYDDGEKGCVEGEVDGGGGDVSDVVDDLCTCTGSFPLLPDCKIHFNCFQNGSLFMVEEGSIATCATGEIFTGGACTEPTPPAGKMCDKFGLNKNPYDCKSYHICKSVDGDPINPRCCEGETVFDLTQKGCVDPATTDASVVCYDECALNAFAVTPVCSSNAATTAAPPNAASTDDASNAASTDDPSNAASTDDASNAASTDDPSNAASTDDPSNADPTTTPLPQKPTCKKEGTMAYPGDCRKYYVCRYVNGKLEAREFKCPGDLVFDPQKLYCTTDQSVCPPKKLRFL
ncbi:uncharacterized protein LOC143035772 [Oratosquilla oratoria]|uniref:uncharacterized protein LOC143035772 n=1 Tax=Oratosquilla oratoria TaxID=337810 RepID=UPI003F75F984